MLRQLLISSLFIVLACCAGDPDTIVVSDASGSNTGTPTGSRDAAGIRSSEARVANTPNSALPGSSQDFELNVGDRVFFALDSTELDSDATSTLDGQAEWFAIYPSVTVTIEGHTDERGTSDYNLALGDRRAATVRKYLVSRGVDPSRLLTISYGEERPVDPAHDDVAWALNRRAVTVINRVN